MTISIAMATYNGQPYISDQLSSFAKQTRLPDELVICDDGSTDDTIDLIEAFVEIAPFPVFLYKNARRLGYVQNFHQALQRTKGDIIFLSDQDDVWWPEKISVIVRAFENNKDASLFINDAELVDRELKSAGFSRLDQLRSAGLPEQDFVIGCCCAMRRDFLKLALPIPTNHSSHDAWLVKISQAFGEYRLVDKPLQYYRRHGTNSSNYIANRLTRITKFTLYLDVLKRILNKKESRPIELSIEGTLLLERLEEILPTLQHSRAEHANNYITDLKCLVALNLVREEIRRAALPRRIPLALHQYIKGGYKASSGFKSMLRDLLG